VPGFDLGTGIRRIGNNLCQDQDVHARSRVNQVDPCVSRPGRVIEVYAHHQQRA
jgi:hypothetical protein